MEINPENSSRLANIFNVKTTKAWETDGENRIKHIPSGIILRREGAGDSSLVFSTSFPRYNVNREKLPGDHQLYFGSGSQLYRNILELWDSVEDYHDSDERVNDDMAIYFDEMEPKEEGGDWVEEEEDEDY